jgi:hypothetical protein
VRFIVLYRWTNHTLHFKSFWLQLSNFFLGQSMFQNSILKNSPQDEKLIASRWANYQRFQNKIDTMAYLVMMK